MPGVIPPVHTVSEEGTVIATRPTLNFIGSAVTAADNAASNRTDVTITAGGTTNVTFAANSGLPVFNVKDATYGALGDGSNDDTAEIQAAIAAAEAATPYRATVFLPFGRYKITSPLVITKPIAFVGEGCIVGDRESNRNYEALGAVIVNAAAATDAIQFTPGGDTTLMPRGLGGLIMRDFGVTTPSPSGISGVQTYDPTGWATCSGTGIAMCGVAPSYAYYASLRNVTVTRHAVGFNFNTDGATNPYNTGSIDAAWCNALLCSTTGFDLRSVESRLSFCRAKNNDPEWGPTKDARLSTEFASSNPVLASGTIGLETNTSTGSTLKYKVGDGVTAYNSLSYATPGDGSFPAQGTYGFRLGADGAFLDNCIAITCTYGFHDYGSNGFHNLTACGADSCANPFYFGAGEPIALVNCWAVPSYWENRTGTYPVSAGYGFRSLGVHDNLTNCVCKLANSNGVSWAGGVMGGSFSYGNAVGNARFVGARFADVLNRASGFTGTIVGNNLVAGVAGSAGSSKGQGNVGVADW